MVPQVSGYVAALAVTNAQLVEGDDLLARIDQRPFALEVEKARSALQSATQSVGASSSQEGRPWLIIQNAPTACSSPTAASSARSASSTCNNTRRTTMTQ
ncbi:biotin/lipoyl-binding protein [Thiorhodococcus minor]|uniref:Biotin/lipoyl-binding protein n=1 Tax=Thiorhodococcus minor TaxID=57489 RepID=A0A6M0K9E0_9GAMM|nr:biotin/lipoyl-binding protein [Thiorhodococcus minor]